MSPAAIFTRHAKRLSRYELYIVHIDFSALPAG